MKNSKGAKDKKNNEHKKSRRRRVRKHVRRALLATLVIVMGASLVLSTVPFPGMSGTH